jgi:hypothetical protein
MKKVSVIIVLLLINIVFFYRQIFLGEIFYFGDNTSVFLPVLETFLTGLKNGRFLLWNPYLFSGLPFAANFSLGILNPLNFLFFFLPAFRALTWEIMIEFFLASFFGFLFLRVLGQKKFEAVLTGVMFAFSASLLTLINNISLLSTAWFLPLIFWLAKKVLEKPGPAWSLFLGLALALQFFSGHPQPTFYTFSLLGFYFLFNPSLSLGLKIKRGLISLLAFLVLAGPGLLAFGQLAFLSNRPGDNFSYASLGSLHPALLIRFFLPHFFGAAAKGFSWGPAYRTVADNSGYFGLIGLLIIISGWLGRKKSFETKFFTIVFWLTILLALGRFTPVFGFFYRFFPGFKFFRNPAQILVLTNFSAAVLAGLFWSSFLAWLKRKSTKKIIAAWLKLNWLLVLFLGIIFLKKEACFEIFYQWLDRLYFLLKDAPLAKSPFHNFQVDELIFKSLIDHFLLNSIFLLVFGLIVFLFKRKKLNLKMFSFLILVLIFFNLFVFNRNNYFSAQPALFETENEAAEFIKDQGQWRFISSAGYWPYTGLAVYWENMALRPPLAESVFTTREEKAFETLKGRLRTLPPDWGMKYGLSTPMGFSDLILADYAAFMGQSESGLMVNSVAPLPLDDERLNFLGVKYFLVDAGFPFISLEIEKYPQYVLVAEIKNVKIYENQAVWPRAFLEDDKGDIQPAEIIDYQPNRVELEIEVQKTGRLILSDVFYPGWKVLVDGREEEIERYRGVFRATRVLPGQHRVEFIFQPKFLGWEKRPG